jgi:hypothetical protein
MTDTYQPSETYQTPTRHPATGSPAGDLPMQADNVYPLSAEDLYVPKEFGQPDVGNFAPPPAYIKGIEDITTKEAETHKNTNEYYQKRQLYDANKQREALSATEARAGDIPKPWNADEQMGKYISTPLERFGSVGTIFAMLASGFSRRPAISALNAGAAAMNAINAGDEAAYQKAYSAWKDNTNLAIKRFDMQQTVFNDTQKLFDTDMNLWKSQSLADAAKFDDKRAINMLSNGMYKEYYDYMGHQAEATGRLREELRGQEIFNSQHAAMKEFAEDMIEQHGPKGAADWNQHQIEQATRLKLAEFGAKTDEGLVLAKARTQFYMRNGREMTDQEETKLYGDLKYSTAAKMQLAQFSASARQALADANNKVKTEIAEVMETGRDWRAALSDETKNWIEIQRGDVRKDIITQLEEGRDRRLGITEEGRNKRLTETEEGRGARTVFSESERDERQRVAEEGRDRRSRETKAQQDARITDLLASDNPDEQAEGHRLLDARKAQRVEAPTKPLTKSQQDAQITELLASTNPEEQAKGQRMLDARHQQSGISKEDIEGQAEAIAAYRQRPYSGARGNRGVGTDIMRRVYEINPDYNERQYWALNQQTKVAGVAETAADAGSLKLLVQSKDALQSFEKTAIRNLDVLLKLAQKTDRTGIPVLNAWINAGRKATGDPDVAAFNTQWFSTVPEVARIVTQPRLVGVLTDTARHEARDALPQAANIKQLKKSISVLKQDFQNRSQSVDEQISDVKARLRGEKPTERVKTQQEEGDLRIQGDSIFVITPDGQAKYLRKASPEEKVRLQ